MTPDPPHGTDGERLADDPSWPEPSTPSSSHKMPGTDSVAGAGSFAQRGVHPMAQLSHTKLH